MNGNIQNQPHPTNGGGGQLYLAPGILDEITAWEQEFKVQNFSLNAITSGCFGSSQAMIQAAKDAQIVCSNLEVAYNKLILILQKIAELLKKDCGVVASLDKNGMEKKYSDGGYDLGSDSVENAPEGKPSAISSEHYDPKSQFEEMHSYTSGVDGSAVNATISGLDSTFGQSAVKELLAKIDHGIGFFSQGKIKAGFSDSVLKKLDSARQTATDLMQYANQLKACLDQLSSLANSVSSNEPVIYSNIKNTKDYMDQIRQYMEQSTSTTQRAKLLSDYNNANNSLNQQEDQYGKLINGYVEDLSKIKWPSDSILNFALKVGAKAPGTHGDGKVKGHDADPDTKKDMPQMPKSDGAGSAAGSGADSGSPDSGEGAPDAGVGLPPMGSPDLSKMPKLDDKLKKPMGGGGSAGGGGGIPTETKLPDLAMFAPTASNKTPNTTFYNPNSKATAGSNPASSMPMSGMGAGGAGGKGASSYKGKSENKDRLSDVVSVSHTLDKDQALVLTEGGDIGGKSDKHREVVLDMNGGDSPNNRQQAH